MQSRGGISSRRVSFLESSGRIHPLVRHDADGRATGLFTVPTRVIMCIAPINALLNWLLGTSRLCLMSIPPIPQSPANLHQILTRNRQFGARSPSASASSARRSRPRSRSTSSASALSCMASGSSHTRRGTRSAAAASRAWACSSSWASPASGRPRPSGGPGSLLVVSRLSS